MFEPITATYPSPEQAAGDIEQATLQNGSSESFKSSVQAPEDTRIALQEDVPPNGGYAWVCTASVFLINAHTWGINGVSDSISNQGD